MSFPFEKLNVYQQTLSWIADIQNCLWRNPRTISPALHDQFNRASFSIALNLAEGNSRWDKAEKRRFFWSARGSVFECVAILDVLQKCDCLTGVEYQRHYFQLEAIGKMLADLVREGEDSKRKQAGSDPRQLAIREQWL